jgi:hypothetical protein
MVTGSPDRALHPGRGSVATANRTAANSRGINKRHTDGNLLSRQDGNTKQPVEGAGKANRKLLCENNDLMNVIYDVREIKSDIDWF